MATIYDVAKEAGVSPKTVSRVLNGDGPVKAETRDAVHAAMQALGYVPSLAARSIKSRRTGLIGLITGAINSVEDIAAAAGLPEIHIVQGVQRVVSASGKTLLISDTDGRVDRVPELVRTFREHRVEGLIYIADCHKRIDFEVPSDSIQTVLVNCYDDVGTPAVLPDDEAGQRALTCHLIKEGHRRIAYLTLSPHQDATRLRLDGFRAAHAEAGIPFDKDLIAPTDLFGSLGEMQMIWDALDRLLRNDRPPTAICCGNDRLAMSVYGVLRDRGISVPDEMSVAGYDDHRVISESLYPPLTTAELPYHAMGGRAAQTLLEMIDGEETALPPAPILVGGQVQVRGSVTRPRAEDNRIVFLKGREYR